jgi:hypothetical protein
VEPTVITWNTAECPAGPVEVTHVTCEAQRAGRDEANRPARHVQVSSVEDVEAILRANPKAVMGWEILALHVGAPWIEAGLLCPRHDPSQVLVVEFPILPDVATARAVYGRISAHNRSLLAAGRLDPTLGCSEAPDLTAG